MEQTTINAFLAVFLAVEFYRHPHPVDLAHGAGHAVGEASVAGALALEFMTANPESEFARVLGELLDKRVTRAIDRALFPALPALKSSANTQETSSSD